MYPVLVPSNSVASVAVTGPACGPNALVEPLSVPVPGNLQLANTLVDASKTCFLIQVANPFQNDVWLKPRTRLGTVHGAVTVTSGEQLQFDVHSNEVIVSYPLSAEQQKPTPPPPQRLTSMYTPLEQKTYLQKSASTISQEPQQKRKKPCESSPVMQTYSSVRKTALAECKNICGTQFSRYLFSARSYTVN